MQSKKFMLGFMVAMAVCSMTGCGNQEEEIVETKPPVNAYQETIQQHTEENTDESAEATETTEPDSPDIPETTAMTTGTPEQTAEGTESAEVTTGDVDFSAVTLNGKEIVVRTFEEVLADTELDLSKKWVRESPENDNYSDKGFEVGISKDASSATVFFQLTKDGKPATKNIKQKQFGEYIVSGIYATNTGDFEVLYSSGKVKTGMSWADIETAIGTGEEKDGAVCYGTSPALHILYNADGVAENICLITE